MRITKHFTIYFLLLTSLLIAQNKEEGLFAEIKTNQGTILLSLDFKKTPVTVANFVSLAEGKNDFVDEKLKGKPFYDGLKFHRVIANFMIQGGDPDGTGAGGPGYNFTDEITDLTHEGSGILSMANAGANTNGSQFFITHKETPWLDGKHTVFGHVVEGQDVVDKIKQGDVIEKITIIKKGKEAKKFKAEKVFKAYMKDKEAEDKRIAALNDKSRENFAKVQEEKRKKQVALEEQRKKEQEAKISAICTEKSVYFAHLKEKATQTDSGLLYVITQKGTNQKPEPGTSVKVAYSGFFNDGKLFDSSNPEVAKLFGRYDLRREQSGNYGPIESTIGQHRFIAGFAEGVDLLHYGEKATLFIPSKLAYGEKGAGGGLIPPNTDLVFEIELVK